MLVTQSSLSREKIWSTDIVGLLCVADQVHLQILKRVVDQVHLKMLKRMVDQVHLKMLKCVADQVHRGGEAFVSPSPLINVEVSGIPSPSAVLKCRVHQVYLRVLKCLAHKVYLQGLVNIVFYLQCSILSASQLRQNCYSMPNPASLTGKKKMSQ